MLKKTISVFILVAIITATIICGNLTVFAEETQGDCVVKYVDLDGNVIATQNYNLGDQITGLDSFESYIQTSPLKLNDENASPSATLQFYDVYSDYDVEEIQFKYNNDDEFFNILSANINAYYLYQPLSPNKEYYFSKPDDPISDFTIQFRVGDEISILSFSDFSLYREDDDIYYYGNSYDDRIVKIELEYEYCFDFFLIQSNDPSFELVSLTLNDEIRYENGVSYKTVSKENLPKIILPEITYIIQYRSPEVNPSNPTEDDELDEENPEDESFSTLEKIKADWENMWTKIEEFFDKIGNWFKDAWQKISDFFKNLSKEETENDEIANGSAANNVAGCVFIL